LTFESLFEVVLDVDLIFISKPNSACESKVAKPLRSQLASIYDDKPEIINQ